jgi:hypothetical protein
MQEQGRNEPPAPERRNEVPHTRLQHHTLSGDSGWTAAAAWRAAAAAACCCTERNEPLLRWSWYVALPLDLHFASTWRLGY